MSDSGIRYRNSYRKRYHTWTSHFMAKDGIHRTPPRLYRMGSRQHDRPSIFGTDRRYFSR